MRASLQPKSRQALYGVVIVTMAGAWYTVLTDPIYTSRWARLWEGAPEVPDSLRPDYARLEKKDPGRGTILPASEAGRLIRSAVKKSEGGTLIASLGDCASCCSINLEKLYREGKRRGIAVVAFSYGDTANANRASEELRRASIPVNIVYDRGAALSGALNATIQAESTSLQAIGG